MGGEVTGCAAACRLAKFARMAIGRLARWAAEMGGGGGRRRWAAEVGGGGVRRRWAAEVGGGGRQHTAAHGSTRQHTAHGSGRQGGRR